MAASPSTLDAFQRDFAAALLGEATSEAGRALAAQPGFAVYRNTVLRGCIDALAANFPTVATLVGREWFDEAAGRFARQQPAARRQPRRLRRRLRRVPRAARCRGRARLSRRRRPPRSGLDRSPSRGRCAGAAGRGARRPGARTLARRRARAAPGGALGRLAGAADLRHLAPPSRAGVARGRACLAGRRRPADPARGERRLAGVEAPAATFLDACAAGRPFAAAAERACPAGAGAGIGTWLPALVAAGAFTRLEWRDA